jgi:regulator of cell morphogenesis and NO signaling
MNAFEMTSRTVGEVAAEFPAAIRVFESWSIDYCCGGRTPLADACSAAGRTVDDFVAAVESSPVAPAADWKAASLAELASVVIDGYHRYTREELLTLRAIGDKVYGVHGQRHPELARVVALIADLTADMMPHMLKEEQVLFPYVTQLERGVAPTPFFGTVKNPVRMMMMEHDAVGEILAKLRAITSDYTLPGDACFSYTQLYRRLAELETKTHEHIHIENNVYFPRAVALEEQTGNAVSGADVQGHHACGCGGHH